MRTALLYLAAVGATLALLSRHSAAGPRNPCPNPADQQAIRAVAEQWKDAYNQGNAARVASLYTKDAYYLTQHFATGVVHPRPVIQAYVQRGVDAHYHIDSVEILATDCSSDMAYAITRYLSTNGAQKARGVNLVVLRRIEGKWLIVAHESAVPEPAVAIQSLEAVSR